MDIENIDFSTARSFPDLRPPNDAVEIFREKKNGNTYYYYQDAKGNLYFESDKGYAFKREMHERERIRKIRKRAGL